MNISIKNFLKSVRQNRKYQIIGLVSIAVFYSAYKIADGGGPRIWGSYRGNSETNAYSPLKEVNKTNVQNLEVAWQFGIPPATGAAAGGRGFGGGGQSNPIVIDGAMYSILNRKVYAVNSTTGEKIWEFDPSTNGLTGAIAMRGVSYWEKASDTRILTTVGYNLIAINAKTGELIKTFGVDGKVDMRANLIPGADVANIRDITNSSPGVVCGDLIIMGLRVDENYGASPGHIRAYNAVTGKLAWTFHTIPHPGEYGYETWPKDAWKEFGGVNDWAGLSVDKKRNMVFIATGGISYDFYGADRHGSNLFADCVVALDAKTGKRKWHFQTIHHDLWDWDLTSPPNLITITKNGKKIDAVAQLSKSGFIFVLDRVTGKSLFPIKEVKAPKSDIPGEQAWPTQPVPVLPKPFSRQVITEADISNFSQAAHDSSVRLFRSFRNEGIWTPPSIKGSWHSPGSNGGADWGGGSFDPTTNIIYIKTNEAPEIIRMQKQVNRAVTNQTDFEIGKTIYTNNCAGCHGVSKGGDEFNYPSLINIQKRMTDEQIIAKIKVGGGKMPGFADAIKGKEAAILSYITGVDNKTYVTAQSGNAPAPAEKVRYTVINAYNAIRDMNRKPFITPPWGTLAAINLATGKYLFQVPAGNDPTLQKPGEPETGLTGNPGAVATAGGIVFLGTSDRKLRAFDSKTGKVISEITLPGVPGSTPSVYQGTDGREYVAVTIGADAKYPSGSIITYRLKSK